MTVFSQEVALPPNQPLGGFADCPRLSRSSSNALEVNGWRFEDVTTGQQHELVTVDSLYAGNLLARFDTAPRRIIAASHTHYAPMLDASKPALGTLAEGAIGLFAGAVLTASHTRVSPEICRIYKTEVPIPVYRRFDVPDRPLNRWLARRAGMYPNERQLIDRHLYLFEFSSLGNSNFVVALHACHPVSRHNPNEVSPDYVGAIRVAVRARFGNIPCLFLLGCAGDIRPNLARRRIALLPRCLLNWRFEPRASLKQQHEIDRVYAAAVHDAPLSRTLRLGSDGMRIEYRMISLKSEQQPIAIPTLVIAETLRFEFTPFEVSHIFHLDAHAKDPMRFIVSCSGHTRGYLPHPKQLNAGGYEVDASRTYMGMPHRAELAEGNTW